MFKINEFINKFMTYTNSFIENGQNSSIKENIEHKIRHSLNVLANSRKIANSENFSSEDFFISELCGLFHDIGRFEQYAKYKTFRDSQTLYHGQLGVEVLKKEKFLTSLPDRIIEIVYCTTYTHGLIEIPNDVKGEKLKFSKLLRDADKLDIFSIIAKYYNTKGSRDIATEYGLSKDDIISKNILEKFLNKDMISKSELTSLNDFKIMQLSWIFSLNFNYSKEHIRDSKILDNILSSITDSTNIKQISQFISKTLNLDLNNA